jgi:hypothetical protein
MALVARPVSSAEARGSAQAIQAKINEWTKLRGKCWNEKLSREMKGVIYEAKRKGKKIQFARVHCILVEKGSELPEGHPDRKFKGRVVLLGNQILSQNFTSTMFADLGNAPTLMEGSKITDFFGCLLGHGCEQADADQAFIQGKNLTQRHVERAQGVGIAWQIRRYVDAGCRPLHQGICQSLDLESLMPTVWGPGARRLDSGCDGPSHCCLGWTRGREADQGEAEQRPFAAPVP